MNADRVELAKLAFLGLNRAERRAFMATFTDPAPPPASAATPGPDRIIRRGQVAEMLARSERAVDRLAVSGALRKVRFPGQSRAAGFRLADVQALIGGAA